MNVNDPRWASIDAFVEENRDNILRDITRLVAVPSVEGAPEPGAPFGPGPKAALAKALEIADELGLDTFNADSYIGWAETGRILKTSLTPNALRRNGPPMFLKARPVVTASALAGMLPTSTT